MIAALSMSDESGLFDGKDYSPCKKLWAEVAETMVSDWRHLVWRKKTLYQWMLPFANPKGVHVGRPGRHTCELRVSVIEALEEDIFNDEDRPGTMYWICRVLFEDEWETRLSSIRDNLRRDV